jgi:hypothetical protein
MDVSDGNFALACWYGMDYHEIHIFQCMLERTDAITNEVLEQIMFILAYPTVEANNSPCSCYFLQSFHKLHNLQREKSI